MKSRNTAFTFVELIVVLVIIAILSTIGFTMYESYLSVWRDTARVTQLWWIHQSLNIYSTTSKLPYPTQKIDIQVNGNVFAYQWNLDEDIAKTISFKGNVKDKELDIYPTYMLSKNRKDFQILSFIEDPETLQTYTPEVLAETDYQLLYPITIGRPLGIILETATKKPIQEVDAIQLTWSIDVVTDTGSYIVYLSNSNYFDTNQDNFSWILPNRSCKRILEMWNSQGDGVYTISPTGSWSLQVYCDMRTDGWGWTFVAYTDTRNSKTDLFNSAVWNYNTNRKDNDIPNTNSSYSINASTLGHTEMMVSIDNKDPFISTKDSKLIFYKYHITDPWFYQWPLPCGITSLAQYKLWIWWKYQISTNSWCNAGNWYFNNSIGPMLRFYSGRGIYWYNGMWWDGSRNHSSWIYVR